MKRHSCIHEKICSNDGSIIPIHSPAAQDIPSNLLYLQKRQQETWTINNKQLTRQSNVVSPVGFASQSSSLLRSTPADDEDELAKLIGKRNQIKRGKRKKLRNLLYQNLSWILTLTSCPSSKCFGLWVENRCDSTSNAIESIESSVSWRFGSCIAVSRDLSTHVFLSNLCQL